MTTCGFRACTLPAAGFGHLLCDHDRQYWCFNHMRLMNELLAPDTHMTCAHIYERTGKPCSISGRAEDVYVFEWIKEGSLP